MLSVLLTAGCSGFDHKIGKPGMKRKADMGPDLSADHRIQPVYVGLLEAQEWVGSLSDVYQQASAMERTKRVVVDSTLIATAILAIQKVAVGDSATSAANLALFGTGIALLNQRILNPMHKEIYAQGARALTCVYSAVNQVPHSTDLLALDLALSDQRSAVDTLDDLCKKEADEALKTTCSSVVQSGRQLNHDVGTKLAILDPRGRQVIAKAQEIHQAVETELNRSEPQPLKFNEILQQAVNMAEGSTLINVSNILLPPEGGDDQAVTTLNTKILGLTDADAITRLDTAYTKLKAADTHLRAVLNKIIRNGRIQIPAMAFNKCAFAIKRPVLALRLSRKEITLDIPDTATELTGTHEFEVTIMGGRSPFTLVENPIAGVSSQLVTETGGTALLRIKLALSSSGPSLKNGDTLMIVVRDDEKSEQSLMIRARWELITRIQKFLKEKKNGNDPYLATDHPPGVWDKATIAAARKYLKKPSTFYDKNGNIDSSYQPKIKNVFGDKSTSFDLAKYKGYIDGGTPEFALMFKIILEGSNGT